MRRRRTTAFIFAIACILFSGCEGKVDPEFVASTDFCLQVKGQTLYSFDALTWQAAFNRSRREFRVHTDNMSDYWCVTLNGIPTAEGQKFKGDILWTSRRDIKRLNDLNFSVKKIDPDGRIWLWCRKEQIGAVIQTTDKS